MYHVIVCILKMNIYKPLIMATPYLVADIIAKAIGVELVSFGGTMQQHYERKLREKQAGIGDRTRFDQAVERIKRAEMSDDHKYIYLSHFLDRFVKYPKQSIDDHICGMPRRLKTAMMDQHKEENKKILKDLIEAVKKTTI